MKKQLILTGLFLSVLAFSCSMEEEPLPPGPGKANVSFTLDEARSFFEEYVADLDWSQQEGAKGITPGDFTPEWEAAKCFGNAAMASINVPLMGAIEYEGYMPEDYTKLPKDDVMFYHSAIGQKLLITKNANGQTACMIVTIIPAEECASPQNADVARLFNHGAENTDFSGLVLYSAIEENYTISAVRLRQGVLYTGAGISKKHDYATNVKNMRTVCGYMAIRKKPSSMRTTLMTENDDGSYDGGTLGDVVVTGGSDYSDEPDYFGGGYYSGGSSGGSGGGSGNGYHDVDLDDLIDLIGNNGNSVTQEEIVAPKATRIFRNSDMTLLNWAAIERMLEKITSDCLGKAMYNGLVNSLKGKTLIFKFGDENGGNYFGEIPGQSTGFGINLSDVNVESNMLFHEMMHAYQAYQEKDLDTYFAASLNLEIEAWYVQYLYLQRLPEYENSKWETLWTTDDVSIAIARLSTRMDYHGKLLSGTTEESLNTYVMNLKNALQLIPAYRGEQYKYDSGRFGFDNFKNLLKLSKNC